MTTPTPPFFLPLFAPLPPVPLFWLRIRRAGLFVSFVVMNLTSLDSSYEVALVMGNQSGSVQSLESVTVLVS